MSFLLSILTKDQWLSLLRSILIAGGSALAAKGLLTADQAAWLSTPEALGIVLGAGGAIAGLLARRKTSMVAAVAALPEVQKVEMHPTDEGEALAQATKSTPSATVTVGAP